MGNPLFLSPALPSDLVQFVINRCSYPTTLIICADRADFLSSLTQDLIQQQQQQQQTPQPHTADKTHDTAAQQATDHSSHPDQQGREPEPPGPQQPHTARPKPTPKPQHHLLTPSLSQLSTTHHIRTVFIPTVSHLRAFLSVFSVTPNPSSSSSSATLKIPPPPPPPSHLTSTTTTTRGRERVSRLVVFDFLALHRHTSEWSVQGLGLSSALLVEAGRREGVQVVVVESRASDSVSDSTSGQGMKELLGEQVPVLSGGSARKVGGGEFGGKRVDVGRVLARWFRFRDGGWHGS